LNTSFSLVSNKGSWFMVYKQTCVLKARSPEGFKNLCVFLLKFIGGPAVCGNKKTTQK